MLSTAEEVRSFGRRGHQFRTKGTGRRGHCAEEAIDFDRRGPADADIVPKWTATLNMALKLINIIHDVVAAILIEKMVALSRPQFCSDFLQILFVDTLLKY